MIEKEQSERIALFFEIVWLLNPPHKIEPFISHK